MRTVAHLGRDPRGADDLAALAAPAAPAATGPVRWPVADRIAEDGVLVWHLPCPAPAARPSTSSAAATN